MFPVRVRTPACARRESGRSALSMMGSRTASLARSGDSGTSRANRQVGARTIIFDVRACPGEMQSTELLQERIVSPFLPDRRERPVSAIDPGLIPQR